MNIRQKIREEKTKWLRARRASDAVGIKMAAYNMYCLEMQLKESERNEIKCNKKENA